MEERKAGRNQGDKAIWQQSMGEQKLTLSQTCSSPHNTRHFDLWFVGLAVELYLYKRKNPVCISKGITFQSYSLWRFKGSQVLPPP